MLLSDIVLDIDLIASSELVHDKPEAKWVNALYFKSIPQALFDFYCACDYFSFPKCPPFLADSEKLLFPYLSDVVGGLCGALVEADRLVKEVEHFDRLSYSPTKHQRGEHFEVGAADEMARSLRYLMINLSSSLDLMAECASVILPSLPGVRSGRGSFQDILNLLNSNKPPDDALGQRFLEAISKELSSTGPDKDWHLLLMLYRNKLAHMGRYMFMVFHFHDRNGDFFPFLPRKWPYNIKSHIRRHDDPTPARPFRDLFEDLLVHVDAVNFCKHLTERVKDFHSAAFTVLTDAYLGAKGGPVNLRAFSELKQNSKECDFKYFPK